MQTDYEQWKSWLDKWGVQYYEYTYEFREQKELEIEGSGAEATIEFDLNEKFIRMSAYD